MYEVVEEEETGYDTYTSEIKYIKFTNIYKDCGNNIDGNPSRLLYLLFIIIHVVACA